MKNQIKEVNKVYKTEDLSIFNQIKGNRPPNPQHIRRLADSIKTYGILQSPIIVNENFDVIDGQHRLLAAKEAKSSVYYIIVDGYELQEVQVLNLNQKNWSKSDFMEGYANMNIDSYVKLKNFYNRNNDFNLSDCVAMCSNTSGVSTSNLSQRYKKHKGGVRVVNQKEVFEEGTWVGKDFNLAQEYANKLRMIKPYYKGYNRSSFVGTMTGLFRNKDFNFVEFLSKLKLQSQSLQDCASVAQYKLLIEDIYNYKRREKVNLRF